MSPKRWKLASHNFPETEKKFFFKSLFWFTNTAKIKKRHKTKILQFEKLDPADKANHFFCYFAFKISQMTDWFFKNCFNFVLTSVPPRPSVDSFGEDIFTCEPSSLFEDFYKPRKEIVILDLLLCPDRWVGTSASDIPSCWYIRSFTCLFRFGQVKWWWACRTTQRANTDRDEAVRGVWSSDKEDRKKDA